MTFHSVTSEATLSPLLDAVTATRMLSCLARAEDGSALPAPGRVDMSLNLPGLNEADRVQALLDLLNDGGLSPARWKELEEGYAYTVSTNWGPTRDISAERREALRAFLAERVAIHEREKATRKQRVEEAAREGRIATPKLAHRTVALSIAAATLPGLLNGRVHKSLLFSNSGTAKTRKGLVKSGPLRGKRVNVVMEGGGGELAVVERVRCDGPETALSYALALVLDKKREFGQLLCRCHVPGCGRFWLLQKRKGKQSRAYCPLHADESKRLGDRERKRRQRLSESRARKAK